jgi:two-component system chemotaxis response regulator CheY
VLLVEDDPVSLHLTRKALGTECQVITAQNGMEARNAYVLNAPDLVFLDIGLPDVDGHKVLERLLALEPGAHVIMLSGNSYRQEIVKAVQAGAKGFIGKPFTREKLLQALRTSPAYREYA